MDINYIINHNFQYIIKKIVGFYSSVGGEHVNKGCTIDIFVAKMRVCTIWFGHVV